MHSANTTLPISEVRRDIFQITTRVQKPGVTFTVTENGRPKAVILSADEFESLIETLEIIHEYPAVMKAIENSRNEYRQGKYVTLDQFDTKKTYVSSRRTDKRKKTATKISRKR